MKKIAFALLAFVFLTGQIAVDQKPPPVTVGDHADNTAGDIPTWGADGAATVFGPGTIHQYVASQGAGAEPIFKSILDEDDMVSDSATDIASQQSIKAFVTAGTITMSAKTLTSPVLNGTITGDAFLDEDNMVSDSAVKLASQQSIKKYVDDNATATKEFFITHQGAPSTTGVGDWQVRLVGSAAEIFFTFMVPHDFTSLTSADVLVLPDATETLQWDQDVSVSASGETHDNDARQALNETLAVTVNVLAECDVSASMTGLAAGDYVGLRFQSDTDNIKTLGLRVRYN